jgi:hypothetical protein
MNRTVLAAVLAAATLAGGSGCKKSPASSGSTGATSGSAASGGSATATGKPLGVLDPTPKINGATEKSLSRGNKALSAKKYADAAAAYREVLAATPDYLPARWLLVRSLVLGGQLGDVPAEYEELVARAYPIYANKLDKGREAAALRSSPEWAKIEALRTQYRAAYGNGLDKGFLFVDRLRPAKDAALHQEAFHYDPAGKRFRQLTETGGKVFAVNRTPNGKWATALTVEGATQNDTFGGPKLLFVDLATSEVHGPMALKGNISQIELGVNNFGDPEVVASDNGGRTRYVLDSSKTGLATIDVDPVGAGVLALPAQISYAADKSSDGVTLAQGASMFTVGGVDKPITSARPILQSSLDWSPKKQRITYAGQLDPCKAGDKNELFVFDKATKTAQRVAQAVSFFETLWLNDDQLVYETGVGADGRIGIYDLAAHAPTVLATRFGAGLYGVPTLKCQAPSDDANIDDASGALEGEAENDPN